MNSPEPFDIFVSYASVDREQVLKLLAEFRDRGIRFWRDQEQLLGASSYGVGIVRAIQQARVFVLICSRASLSSDNVRNEIINNWDRGNRCYLPIWIEPPSAIPDELAYWLAGCQWIETHGLPPETWMPQVLVALRALGIETSNSRSESSPEPSRSKSESASSVTKSVFGSCTLDGNTSRSKQSTPGPQPKDWKRNEGHSRSRTASDRTVTSSGTSTSDFHANLKPEAVGGNPGPETRTRELTVMSSPLIAKQEQDLWGQMLGMHGDRPQEISFNEISFCLIPPGRCSVGASPDDSLADQDEKPAIKVEIPEPLLMMKVPLTCSHVRSRLSFLTVHQRWRQWERSHQDFSNHCPAAELSIVQLADFCEAFFSETGVRLRLPTEAEWEYSARAGSITRYWWGNDFESNRVICSVQQPMPCTDTRRNAWGLVDVLGNVAEWTSSAYGPLHSKLFLREACPTALESRYRVVRGGSFREQRPAELRVSRRRRVASDSSARFIGARLVADSVYLPTMMRYSASEKGST